MGYEITDVVKIGENDHGYWFGAGVMGGRWVGFAVATLLSRDALGDLETGIFLLPGISEGHLLGVEDRARCIRLVGAIARSVEHGYGGISRWFVEESMRGRPEDFRCANCDQVGCDGE